MDLLIVMPTYRPLSSMVMYKDCVDDHDVSERRDGNGNKAVPGGEHLKDQDVDWARDWEAEHTPRRLKKQSVQEGEGLPKWPKVWILLPNFNDWLF